MKTDHTNTTLSNTNRGFSLIEVMIAMAIFSIGILAVGSMQLSTTKNNTTGNITTQATMLARQKIEELKNLSRSDLDTADGNDTVGIYDRDWVTAPIPGSTTAYKLIVTVKWPPRRGPERSVVLESISRGNGT
jgi:prepilin-type N-terminal cleavage/methylation domain-containing protein